MKWPPTHPSARKEFDEAFDFFAAKSPVLARRFLKSTMATIARLRDLPESGSPLGRSNRRAVIRPFRYDRVYRMRESEIYILAVAHHARRPGYWSDRS